MSQDICDCDCDICDLHNGCPTLLYHLVSSKFKIRDKEKKKKEI